MIILGIKGKQIAIFNLIDGYCSYLDEKYISNLLISIENSSNTINYLYIRWKNKKGVRI